MSSPSNILKYLPTLYPREWESEHFLRDGSWPQHLSRHHNSDTSRVSRTDEERYRREMLDEMLSEERQTTWVCSYLHNVNLTNIQSLAIQAEDVVLRLHGGVSIV